MSGPQTLQELPSAMKVIQMLVGKSVARAISVAAELGIADALKDAPKQVEELAAATSTHAPSLYRLLRALASVGIFAEIEDRRFTLTPMATCLRTEAPDSIRNLARWFGAPLSWSGWGELLHCVKTGETGVKQALGVTDPFAYMSEHPEQAQIFHACMTEISRMNAPGIVGAYDFGRFHKIVDVGGSHGLLLSAILRRYPSPRGILFDLPRVVEGAKRVIAADGLTERCEPVAGNFFESVPAGADAYILKQVIHDWDDAPAVAILRNVRQAIPPEGRLLLIEFVIPPPNEPSLSKVFDLDMLVATGGRERTEIEYRDLFAAAGFTLTAIHPIASGQSVIEGVPLAAS
jgi:O-methyltransferase domain/Dimerisation domain